MDRQGFTFYFGEQTMNDTEVIQKWIKDVHQEVYNLWYDNNPYDIPPCIINALPTFSNASRQAWKIYTNAKIERARLREISRLIYEKHGLL